MVKCSWWEALDHTKEEWKSALIHSGVEFVLPRGMVMMLQLFVGSLDIHHMVSKNFGVDHGDHFQSNFNADATTLS